MTQKGHTRAQSGASSQFTFLSKRWARPRLGSGLAAGAGAILMLLALPDQVAARPQIGPTSSASIKISVSVAPRFGLGAGAPAIHDMESATAGAGRFCLAVNGRPTDLPVMLVWPSTGQTSPVHMGKERVEQLIPCNSARAPEAADRQVDTSASGLLIIRPE